MPRVRFRSPFDDVVIEVPEGTSLLEAAEQCGATVGHACGGVCACSTCHVWVKRGLESLSEQEDNEADRLDQAFDVKPTSRLGCQSIIEKAGATIDVEITQESLQS
ncbi:MAG: 2Fe-2S iron-sulfur cluster-binding protein, partial [Myxococcaceae bacterium]